jgi:eukaryotic-like serine/threonine-protein kinase
MSDRTLRSTDPVRVGGRYVVQEELGRGGMATVQRAHDPVLDRTVAVKLLHDHLATDPAFLDRFRREARAAAALDHPNVVGVYDWGESDEGAYLVLQLVDGPSLREVLRTHGRLTPRATLAILGPAAAGLAAAPDAGLVHRDVKPENLLLGRDGGVRVTDFGLARAAASATSTFGADVLVGSPHYLSPEAVRGEPLDPRADVYGLGVVLFECLTGRPPHEGESPFATAVAHTARRVPAPSSVVPDLGRGLDEVVRTATAIDVDERYPDAASFGTALAQAVHGEAGGSAGGHVPTVLLEPPPPPSSDTSTRVVEPDDAATAVVGATHAEGGDGDEGAEGDEVGAGAAARGALVPGVRIRRAGRAWLVVAILAALIGGSGLGGYLLWDRVLAPVTPIPEVLGAEAADARDQLLAAGFEVAVAEERPHDVAVPEGRVLDMMPSGELRQGRTVTLVLSAGPRMIEIPALVEDPADEARDELRELGFEPTLTEAHDEEIPEGAVVATEPPAGEVVPEASELTLVVSLGPEPIDVPALVGGSESDAAATLRDLGLELVVADRRYDTTSEGTVLGQDPEEGATLHRGDEVEVTVSRGPEPIEVPNVRGARLDDALEELRGLGLEVEVERRGGFRALLSPGRVYEQDPGPDSVVRRGDTVQLWAYED